MLSGFELYPRWVSLERSTAIAGLVEGHRIDREDLSNAM